MAAAEFNSIYEKTNFELYKASFKENLTTVRIKIHHFTVKNCSELGVHLVSEEDKHVIENCKKAIKMI